MLYGIEDQRSILTHRGQTLSALSPQSLILTRATKRRTQGSIQSAQQIVLATTHLTGTVFPKTNTIAAMTSVTLTAEHIFTAFSASLPTSSATAANLSFRQVISPIASGGTQVRVSFRSAGGIGWAVDHVSIGTQNTSYNTTATPIELLFNGASGFSIGTSTTKVSDWTTFTTVASTNVIVIGDNSNTASMAVATASSGVVGCVLSTIAATDSYNVASPAGSWTTQNNVCAAVIKIEVK